MKSFKYTINGNIYKVHINSVVDDIAEVEVNGTPYKVKMEKPAKKQMVTIKRAAQAPTDTGWTDFHRNDGMRRAADRTAAPSPAGGSHPIPGTVRIHFP